MGGEEVRAIRRRERKTIDGRMDVRVAAIVLARV